MTALVLQEFIQPDDGNAAQPAMTASECAQYIYRRRTDGITFRAIQVELTELYAMPLEYREVRLIYEWLLAGMDRAKELQARQTMRTLFMVNTIHGCPSMPYSTARCA